jgi:hypothetical protein
MLVMMFEREPRLRPFIKHLFDNYGIICVSHWDEAGGVKLFDTFPLDEECKRIFLDQVGVPRRSCIAGNANVVKLRPPRPAI